MKRNAAKLAALIAVAVPVAACGASVSRGGAAAGSGCATVIATFHDGSLPTKRPILVPPAPSLQARAVSAHVVEFKWSFKTLPAKCRPVAVLLSVLNDRPYTPTTAYAPVRATSGTHRIKVADSSRWPVRPPRARSAVAVSARSSFASGSPLEIQGSATRLVNANSEAETR